jgi:outer membrane receptor protein involved in Fe transport
LVTIDDSAQVAYRGKALPLWPRSRWNGRVAWQIPMAQDDLRASVWTAAQWQAGYYLDAANLVALPSRTLVSAGVRTDLPRWGVHIDVRVDNAADVPWYDLVGYPLPGRTAWLQVGWSGREESM